MDAVQRTRIHDGLVALADGDRAAFGPVFEALWPVLLAFVRRATRHHADAEDLAQQTLLKVFARVAEFDTTRDGLSWAFGIAAYEVKTYRRTRERRREVPAEGLAEEAGRGQSQEEAVILRDLEAALTEALGQLSSADRALLLGEPQAADSSSAPAATVRKRRQRALERLRAAWRTLHG